MRAGVVRLRCGQNRSSLGSGFYQNKNLYDSLPLRYAETLCLFKYIMLHTLLLSGLETGNRRLFKDGGSIIEYTIVSSMMTSRKRLLFTEQVSESWCGDA